MEENKPPCTLEEWENIGKALIEGRIRCGGTVEIKGKCKIEEWEVDCGKLTR